MPFPNKDTLKFSFDAGELGKAVITQEGFLRAPVKMSRIGVMDYGYAKKVKKPEELFSDDTIKSFQGMPIDDEHPQVDGKYVYFSINITEENLDEVVYTYIDKKGKEKEKRLCSKLKDGLCEKRVSFKDGTYDLTIQIINEAGNSVGIPASFEIIK